MSNSTATIEQRVKSFLPSCEDIDQMAKTDPGNMRVREIPAKAKIVRAPKIGRDFAVVKVPCPNPAYSRYEIWDVETGLGVPNNPYAKKLKDAVDLVRRDFGLTKSQIEYNTTKGIFSKSALWYSVNSARLTMQ